MSMDRIEKSSFRKGEYVGYADNDVWEIKRIDSACGKWAATARKEKRGYIYAFTLQEMNTQLSNLEQH